jgi:hypothetical protein
MQPTGIARRGSQREVEQTEREIIPLKPTSKDNILCHL